MTLNTLNTINGVPNTSKGLSFALISGMLASIAGTFGKFAMAQSETLWYCETICLSSYFQFNSIEAYNFCEWGTVYFRALAFVLMIFVNAVMLATFLKALRHCHTSLEATVTNTAANFLTSALVGRVLFNETMTLWWWLGTLLIIFGLGLMNFSAKGGSLSRGSIIGNSHKRKIR